MKKLRDVLLKNIDVVFVIFLFVVISVFNYGKDDAQIMLYLERLDYFLMQSVFVIVAAFLITSLFYSFITYEEDCKCCCKCCCCKGEK